MREPPEPPSLEANTFVDPNIGNLGLTVWERHDGGLTSAVQLLVRPVDLRCDESGELPGLFVMVTLTREELRALLRLADEDWAETVLHCGDPNLRN